MTLFQKMDFCLIMAKIKVEKAVHDFFYDENGDTNFISILVLLGIALALAGVFLSYQKQIMTWVKSNIGSFFTTNVDKTKAAGVN